MRATADIGQGVIVRTPNERSLTTRHWQIAAAGGLAVGLANAGSAQLWNLSAHLYNVWTGLTLAMSLALTLPLLIAAAGRAPAAYVPRWAAYAIAGLLAAAAAYVVGFLLLGVWVLGLPQAGGLVVFWIEFPRLAIVGVLAALGWMHWSDASARARLLHSIKIERLRFAREATEARLSALQARVEPSFLFETLSNVERLYGKDHALGERMLDDLIVHLRAALPATDEIASSLAVELKLVETWLDIMRLSSGDRLAFAIASDDVPGDAKMPPMVLLPIVQHGVASAQVGPCAITVAATDEGDRVTVTVVGPDRAFSTAADHPVLAQVRTRVEDLYGDAARFTLSQIAHGRSQATLEIPYERTDRRPR